MSCREMRALLRYLDWHATQPGAPVCPRFAALVRARLALFIPPPPGHLAVATMLTEVQADEGARALRLLQHSGGACEAAAAAACRLRDVWRAVRTGFVWRAQAVVRAAREAVWCVHSRQLTTRARAQEDMVGAAAGYPTCALRVQAALQPHAADAKPPHGAAPGACGAAAPTVCCRLGTPRRRRCCFAHTACAAHRARAYGGGGRGAVDTLLRHAACRYLVLLSHPRL
jgi:hypothetical protein